MTDGRAVSRSKISIGDMALELFMILTAVITLYPFVYIISMSISEPGAVLAQECLAAAQGFSRFL